MNTKVNPLNQQETIDYLRYDMHELLETKAFQELEKELYGSHLHK